MKKIILFLFLLPLVIFAQDKDKSNMDLPNILILGETSLPSDSLSASSRMVKYWHISSLDRFNYTGNLSNFDISEKKSALIQNNGYLRVLGGSPLNGELKFGFHNPKNRVFSVKGFAEYTKPEDGWEYSSGSLSWMPEFNKNNKSIISGWNSIYEMGLDIPKLSFYGGEFIHEIKSETEFFNRIKFLAEYNTYELEDSIITTYEDYDFQFSCDNFIPIPSFFSKLNATYYKENFSGDIAVYFKNLIPFENAGLWIGGDEESIQPSVMFTSTILSNGFMNLKIINDPYVKYTNRRDNLRDNKWIYLETKENQEKVPVNFSLALNFTKPFQLTMIYKNSWHYDYPIYGHLPAKSYTISETGVKKQVLSLNCGYHFKSFAIENSFSYVKPDIEDSDEEYIPFEAKIVNNLNLTTHFQKLYLRTDVNLLIDRVDDTFSEMDDCVLLDIKGSYQLLKKLHLESEINNVLGQEYVEFNDIPYEDLKFKLGFLLLF